MPTIVIDQKRIEAEPGETILHAARRAGIEIPTLCHLEGFDSGASCMVCAVKLKHNGQYIPACGARAVDGMEIEHESDEVRTTRRMALELLFSDHLGDCLSPCERICPVQLGIPAVLKHLRAGQPGLAAACIRRDLPLAGILCRMCDRPCEHGCRRGVHDDAVAIADLVIHAMETERASGQVRPPVVSGGEQGSVAVVGSGFTGLSAAWFLRMRGYHCDVYEKEKMPAASLGNEHPDLPADLLDHEVGLLRRAGVVIHTDCLIGDGAALDLLLEKHRAVVFAGGVSGGGMAASLGLAAGQGRVEVDKRTMMASRDKVFAAGRAVRGKGKPVMSAADGKAVAECVHQLLSGQTVARPAKPFSVFMGRVAETEMGDFLKDSSPVGRFDSRSGEMDVGHAIGESSRCVHCNCAKADVCKLRQLAVEYDVDLHRFNTGEKIRFQRNLEHPLVNFEPGKCIRCGNCIKVAGDYQESLGLTFIGRGFDVHLGVPFHGSMDQGLQEAARAAVAACPTGALTLREHREEP